MNSLETLLGIFVGLWIVIFTNFLWFIVQANNIVVLKIALYPTGKISIVASGVLAIVILGIILLLQSRNGLTFHKFLVKIGISLARTIKLMFDIILATYISAVLFIVDFGNPLWNLLAVSNAFVFFIIVQEIYGQFERNSPIQ